MHGKQPLSWRHPHVCFSVALTASNGQSGTCHLGQGPWCWDWPSQTPYQPGWVPDKAGDRTVSNINQGGFTRGAEKTTWPVKSLSISLSWCPTGKGMDTDYSGKRAVLPWLPTEPRGAQVCLFQVSCLSVHSDYLRWAPGNSLYLPPPIPEAQEQTPSLGTAIPSSCFGGCSGSRLCGSWPGLSHPTSHGTTLMCFSPKICFSV